MARLIVVRHGETAANVRGEFRGRSSVGLTPIGREQAAYAAARLASSGASRVWSSPQPRALETAEPIARALGVPVEPDEGLDAVDCGAWNGLPYDDVHARWPDLWSLWRSDPGRIRFPGGETLAEVRDRSLETLDRLADALGDGTGVAVTHRVNLRTMLLGVLDASLGAFWRIEIGPGDVAVLSNGSGHWVVEGWAWWAATRLGDGPSGVPAPEGRDV